MTHVGDRIRALRLERQLTLPALADKAGLSKGLLSKLENKADSNPSLETLQKVVKALDVTLSDLLQSGKVQVRRIVLDSTPTWFDAVLGELKREGKRPDEDILQALYVLQTRKGSANRSDGDWLYMYKSLELSFARS